MHLNMATWRKDLTSRGWIGRIFMQCIFTNIIGGTDDDDDVEDDDDDDGANTSLKRSSCVSCALSTWITKSS